MTALTTHDTKRGEDVRARLAVLAEVPERGPVRGAGAGGEHRAEPRVHLPLAQTLAGAGRIEPERMHAYAEKAMREAADGTTWTAPDEAYEATVHALVDAAYDGAAARGLGRADRGASPRPAWSNAWARSSSS